jgi:NAD kinase
VTVTAFEKIVLVRRKTRLEQLVERFNSRGQARFYIEHAGGDFGDYEREDDRYRRSLDETRTGLELGLKIQTVERAIVPTFLFAPSDLVVAVGQDGLVANVAKYVGAQPIVAVNPDPDRFDGVLLPFLPREVRGAVARVVESRARIREITLAEARLADGQRLLGFNDLFIGARTHVSAGYTIKIGDRTEVQSSSGVLVSTGAGSTGWLSSVFHMAAGVAAFTGGHTGRPFQMTWEDPRLVYVVREPYASRASQATLVAGTIAPGAHLELESRMATGGVIFSDGVERDALAFESGAVARIGAAEHRTRLVVGTVN